MIYISLYAAGATELLPRNKRFQKHAVNRGTYRDAYLVAEVSYVSFFFLFLLSFDGMTSTLRVSRPSIPSRAGKYVD